MSELLTIAGRFRRMLLQEERAAASQMARAYNDIWQETRRELATLNRRIEAARDAGLEVTESWLFEQGRLRALESQVAEQVAAFAGRLERQTTQLQEIGIDLADRQFGRSVAAAGVEITLRRLPDQQIAQLVGFLADGSPLSRLLVELGPEAGQRMRDTLIRGVALGWNPREMERRARESQGAVLSRSLKIMRTEALRPYREYAHLNYQANSHVVRGWYWSSALQTRTCASCWAMHGTFHRLDERLDDHPNGRCTQVPAVRGFEFEMQTGVDAFARLGADEQRAVLGEAKYDAYRTGRIGLPDLVARSESGLWGSTRREASLQEALA